MSGASFQMPDDIFNARDIKDAALLCESYLSKATGGKRSDSIETL